MLDKNKALRKFRRTNESGTTQTYYVFKCTNCQDEISVRSGGLSKHKGRCQTCASKHSIKQIWGKLPPTEAAKNRVIQSYKRSATKQGLDWDISEETLNILFNDDCYYCGAPPSNVSKSKNGDYVYQGIDRLDNTQGYTETNCISSCKRCNYAKSNMDEKEFLNWSSGFAEKILETYDIEMYHLYRKEDVSGISGTGVLAIIFKLAPSRYLMEWLGEHRTLTLFESLESIKNIHGHDNKTIVVKGLPKRYHIKKAVENEPDKKEKV